MADRHSMKNTVSVCRSIPICWFDDGNYWWNIIKRDHVFVRLPTHDPFL